MRKIVIKDSGADRYKIISSTYNLGRMYDNMAEEIEIAIPMSEKESVCTMIVSHNGTTIAEYVVGDETLYVTNTLSQYPSVDIGFCFTRDDGYVKSSEVREFKFSRAQKPDDFVVVETDSGVLEDYYTKSEVNQMIAELKALINNE